MSKIKVGVIGVGNCFAGLIQGIEYYKYHQAKEVAGLMFEKIAGYGFQDIEFVCAWDVGVNKVGEDLNKAVYAPPNDVCWINLPKSSVKVKKAPVLDGVGIYVENKIQPISDSTPIEELRDAILAEILATGCEILLNYLPVGSQEATEFWAEIALISGCAFINCIPVFIASNQEWKTRFKESGIPIIGDDVKGQVGATIVHRVLSKLCSDRGTKIDKTYQLNVGGNTDFLNMKEQERLQSKRISKTESVTSQISDEIKADNVYIGPSDFIPFLGNNKLCFIRIEGRMFGDIPYNLELRLDVDDKANSAGVVIDCIRLCKVALDRKIGGVLNGPSAYYMKHPPIQMSDEKANEEVKNLIYSI